MSDTVQGFDFGEDAALTEHPRVWCNYFVLECHFIIMTWCALLRCIPDHIPSGQKQVYDCTDMDYTQATTCGGEVG